MASEGNPAADGRVEALYRYPVKGLSAEPVHKVQLSPGEYFPGDRLFAIENGPSGFDAAAPAHQPKVKFLMLMRNARLAELRTSYDAASASLTIRRGGRTALIADLRTEDGREALAAFFAAFMPDELRGPPRLLAAPAGFRFTDSRRGFVSIINLASVAALEQAVGRTLDPVRFRANVYVAGWPAWHEFTLMDQEITVGGARLRVTKRIERCAATDVDPETAARDTELPRALLRNFGHTDCGVYAEVRQGGAIRPGDPVRTAREDEPNLPF